MPYVPTEEEKARQKEYADKKAIKDKSKNDEMGGDMYYSTFQNLKKVHGIFYQAFPLVTQTSEEDLC